MSLGCTVFAFNDDDHWYGYLYIGAHSNDTFDYGANTADNKLTKYGTK
jgi:hypothetical protein